MSREEIVAFVEQEMKRQLDERWWSEVKGNFLSFSLAILFVELLIGAFSAIL